MFLTVASSKGDHLLRMHRTLSFSPTHAYTHARTQASNAHGACLSMRRLMTLYDSGLLYAWRRSHKHMWVTISPLAIHTYPRTRLTAYARNVCVPHTDATALFLDGPASNGTPASSTTNLWSGSWINQSPTLYTSGQVALEKVCLMVVSIMCVRENECGASLCE